MAAKKDPYRPMREGIVRELSGGGYLKGARAKAAMRRVPRECFVLAQDRASAYGDHPLSIVGEATISAPHMHAIYLSESGLKPGDSVLEVGFGSGILLAYALEVVGPKGKVVGIEISPEVYIFGKENLERAGYGNKVELKLGDIGIVGKAGKVGFDKIFVSATVPGIPETLLSMLKPGGTMLVPVQEKFGNQELTKVTKTASGNISLKKVISVVFVPLQGRYGFGSK